MRGRNIRTGKLSRTSTDARRKPCWACTYAVYPWRATLFGKGSRVVLQILVGILKPLRQGIHAIQNHLPVGRIEPYEQGDRIGLSCEIVGQGSRLLQILNNHIRIWACHHRVGAEGHHQREPSLQSDKTGRAQWVKGVQQLQESCIGKRSFSETAGMGSTREALLDRPHLQSEGSSHR
jgi:hypothetical protein